MDPCLSDHFLDVQGFQFKSTSCHHAGEVNTKEVLKDISEVCSIHEKHSCAIGALTTPFPLIFINYLQGIKNIEHDLGITRGGAPAAAVDPHGNFPYITDKHRSLATKALKRNPELYAKYANVKVGTHTFALLSWENTKENLQF